MNGARACAEPSAASGLSTASADMPSLSMTCRPIDACRKGRVGVRRAAGIGQWTAVPLALKHARKARYGKSRPRIRFQICTHILADVGSRAVGTDDDFLTRVHRFGYGSRFSFQASGFPLPPHRDFMQTHLLLPARRSLQESRRAPRNADGDVSFHVAGRTDIEAAIVRRLQRPLRSGDTKRLGRVFPCVRLACGSAGAPCRVLPLGDPRIRSAVKSNRWKRRSRARRRATCARLRKPITTRRRDAGGVDVVGIRLASEFEDRPRASAVARFAGADCAALFGLIDGDSDGLRRP